MYKNTQIYSEPDDFEVLRFQPSWHDESVIIQSVGIAPLKDNETSIIMTKYTTNASSFVHFVFTEEETNLLIEALCEVKKRWGVMSLYELR